MYGATRPGFALRAAWCAGALINMKDSGRPARIGHCKASSDRTFLLEGSVERVSCERYICPGKNPEIAPGGRDFRGIFLLTLLNLRLFPGPWSSSFLGGHGPGGGA